MAWTTLPTYTDGNVLTAAQLNAIKDNINESAAAKVTTAGQVLVSTGPNALAARGLASNRVGGGSQTTTNAVFGDNLITVGPTVTLNTGSQALVTLTSFMANNTVGQGCYMAFAVSGATTIAATAERSLRLMSSNANERNRASAVVWQTGLNIGSNTFKAQYAVVTTTGANVGDWDEREIAVLPLT